MLSDFWSQVRWLIVDSEVSFEKWLDTISSFETSEDQWSAGQRITCLPPRVVSNYLQRLLTNAPALLAGITPVRLGHLIWFFNGICSSYWHDVRSEEVPQEDQIATVRAIGNFYRDFLDKYPLGDTADETMAETAVYMMWDMDCLEGAAMFPGEEHLVDPIFEVLGIALRCKSFGCQRSALHGLGHLQRYHQDRVCTEIDWALSSSHLHTNLKDYALEARTGMIQ
ncbi:MAG: hypothetical protein KF836_08425 [Fimbriimonadaceae bacterium]|nr:hypothetical protein [Fimbriimonadaceae bacterium]